MKPCKHIRLLVMLVCSGLPALLQAQDSLHLTLPQAEEIFLKKNLVLLAQHYNIDIAQAAVIQARLYNNPNLQFSGAIYNPDQKKWADVSAATGEYAAGLQQLITLAGKRNKQIRIAETGVKMQEQTFLDLLRTLRYTLRIDFYNLYFLQRSVETVEHQLAGLTELSANYDAMAAKETVTLKDAVRIRSMLYDLQGDLTDLQNQIRDTNAEMNMLLGQPRSYFMPQADEKSLQKIQLSVPLADLIDSARQNRPDLKLAQQNLDLSKLQIRYQQALAKPDLSLGAGFDKRGSYVNNASFLNLAIDLPFFNRNQGNIKAAQAGAKQAAVQLQFQQEQVETDVARAYDQWLHADKNAKSYDPVYLAHLNQLLQSMTENFQHKNISLLDFTDFSGSYKDNMIRYYQLQNQRMQALEELQYAAGKPIY